MRPQIDSRLYLLAETPKFLIGYDAEFSNDRDLKNRLEAENRSLEKCLNAGGINPKIIRTFKD